MPWSATASRKRWCSLARSSQPRCAGPARTGAGPRRRRAGRRAGSPARRASPCRWGAEWPQPSSRSEVRGARVGGERRPRPARARRRRPTPAPWRRARSSPARRRCGPRSSRGRARAPRRRRRRARRGSRPARPGRRRGEGGGDVGEGVEVGPRRTRRVQPGRASTSMSRPERHLGLGDQLGQPQPGERAQPAHGRTQPGRAARARPARSTVPRRPPTSAGGRSSSASTMLDALAGVGREVGAAVAAPVRCRARAHAPSPSRSAAPRRQDGPVSSRISRSPRVGSCTTQSSATRSATSGVCRRPPRPTTS